MSPVTHFLTGWVLANAAPLNRRERMVVTFAAVIPDVDGFGAVAEWATRGSAHPVYWFSQYHHSLHNLLFAVIVAIAAVLLTGRRWLVGALALTTFHLHLLEDLLGSRGPDGFDWPVPYLMPFTTHGAWSWSGQWALNAWPNVAITCALLASTLLLAFRRGFSPVEMLSAKADRAVVEALQKRFQLT